MAKEKDEKKVKRRKTSKTLDKRFNNPKAGRPTLEEKELTEDQKVFAELVGRGIDKNIAAEHSGFSDYQMKRYFELPKMKEEIARWKKVFGKIGVERMTAVVDELQHDIVLELRQRIRGSTESSLSEGALMKLFDKALLMSGLLEPGTTESETLTEKRVQRGQPLLPESSGNRVKPPIDMDEGEQIERTIKKEVKKEAKPRKPISFDDDEDDEDNELEDDDD